MLEKMPRLISRTTSATAPWGSHYLRPRPIAISPTPDTIQRVWSDHNLKLWRISTLRFSSEPDFEEKLVDVVGLYWNPSERAGTRRRLSSPNARSNPALAAALPRARRRDDP